MLFSYIISYLGTIIWLLPIYKQRKTEYFHFFLILGVSSPISLIAYYTIHLVPTNISLASTIMLITSLFPKFYKKYIYSIIILTVFFLIASASNDYLQIKQIGTVIGQSIMLLIIANRLLKGILKDNILNIGLLLTVFFLFTAIMKYVVIIIDPKSGELFFYLTTAVVFIVPITLAFMSINDSDYKIRKQKYENGGLNG